MEKKKTIALSLLMTAILFSFSVISAQINDNENASMNACHIYPIKTPRNEIYPASINVISSADALAGGCYAACQFCYNVYNQGGICIDHYGCNCEYYFSMTCKGKPSNVGGGL